jgi:biotin-dependent carboxylase-like uncharacterized protein
MIEILQSGWMTTIQDTGRNGFQAYGVPTSGAFDPFLARVANKLVGNSFDQPFLEFAIAGPSLAFHVDAVMAVCGSGLIYELDGSRIPEFSAVRVRAGAKLNFVRMNGWYGYLAAAGGFDVDPILGSASTSLAAGIGKRLMKDDQLKVRSHSTELYSLRPGYWNYPQESVLHLLPSLHTSHFQERERRKIADHSYRISPQSNRMGIRFQGATLEAPSIRRSVPAIPGTVQIPRDGLPIILGPEGPTTGGYAQMAVISRLSWTVLAVQKPGETIRFDWLNVEDARRMWNFREKLLDSPEAWARI